MGGQDIGNTEKSDWASIAGCATDRRGARVGGGGRYCFRLFRTMRVVADQGLQLQPKVERDGHRRQRAKKAQADVHSPFRLPAPPEGLVTFRTAPSANWHA